MQTTDPLLIKPYSLQESFTALCQSLDCEIPGEAIRVLVQNALPIDSLGQLAEIANFEYHHEEIALTELTDDSFPCLLQLKKDMFYAVVDHAHGQLLIANINGTHQWISEEKVTPYFSGVIHYLTPRPSNPGTVSQQFENRWFKEQLKVLWPAYFQVLLATFLINVLTLALPLFTNFVFDKVLPSFATETLIILSLGMGIVLIFDFILRWLRSYFTDDACRILVRRSELLILSRILKQENVNHRISSGKITRLVQDFSKVKEVISSSVLLSVLDIPFFLLFTFIIWLIGGPLVWVPLTIALILIPISVFSYRVTNNRAIAQAQSSNSKNAFLYEVTDGLDTIRSMGAGQKILNQWKKLVANAAQTEFNTKQSTLLLHTIVASTNQLVVVATMIIGVLLIHNGSIAPGSLFACIILGNRAVAPLMNLSIVLNRIGVSLKTLKQLKELLSDSPYTNPSTEKKETITSPYARQRITEIKGDIALDNLSYRYPGDSHNTLSNISFHIKPGERIALIGASGAGKSTLIKILQGSLSPHTGKVYIDGHDLSRINLEDYRQYYSVCHQEPTIFSGTLRSNLLLGIDHISEKELRKASYTACLDEFAQRCAQGYEHQVTEKGKNLSGGQQQALSLTRALTHNGKLLMLDEPTSAFDNYNEALFCKRLPQFMSENQSLLLITHRLSLLQIVDRIILLAQGRVVADGPRDQILEQMQKNQQQ